MYTDYMEATEKRESNLLRRTKEFVDWHFRGIKYIDVNVKHDSLSNCPGPCLLCGGNLEKTTLPYEFRDESAPSPWPKSMFDAAGDLAQRTLSLVRSGYNSVRP